MLASTRGLAITRNISDSRTVLSPTACGRSPLAEGAKKLRILTKKSILHTIHLFSLTQS